MAALIRRLARGQGLAPTILLLGLLLVHLSVDGSRHHQLSPVWQMYSWLLLVSAVGLAALAILILYNLIGLIRLYRHRVPGSRLTLRLAGIFALLAITPVALGLWFLAAFFATGHR
jgi:nitrogen fixation/metabolism regulation signal transduction histidine kinase